MVTLRRKINKSVSGRPIMYRITLLSVFCFVLFFSTSSAQGVKRYSSTYHDPENTFEPLPDRPNNYLVIIEKDGTANLDTPGAAEAKSLTLNQLKEFFAGLAAKTNSADSSRGKDLVTFRANPSVKVETVIAFVESARNTYTSKIRIEADEGIFIRVPRKIAPKQFVVKPNPLFLLVSAGKDGKLRLNNEDQGSLSDTSKLTGILKKVFHEREINGVFREKSNDIESTVFLKVPLSMTWGDAVKVIRAIHDGGGDPIGLQIESLDK
jgi:biopolymer transport protein ExbD